MLALLLLMPLVLLLLLLLLADDDVDVIVAHLGVYAVDVVTANTTFFFDVVVMLYTFSSFYPYGNGEGACTWTN